MIRFRSFGLFRWWRQDSWAAWMVGDASAAGPQKQHPPTSPRPPAQRERGDSADAEGLRLGMMINEVVDFYSKVLDQDYVPSTR